jgi:hypothetical protein
MLPKLPHVRRRNTFNGFKNSIKGTYAFEATFHRYMSYGAGAFLKHPFSFINAEHINIGSKSIAYSFAKDS